MVFTLTHKIATAVLTLVLGVSVTLYTGETESPQAATVPAVLPSTTLPTTTTTVLAYVNNCSQVATLALAEGLPASELETALRVAVRESRCTSDAFNALDAHGGSYSIYQINGYWCQPNEYWPNGWLQEKGIVETCQDLFDPVTNTRAMVAIWRNSGWLPWKTAS